MVQKVNPLEEAAWNGRPPQEEPQEDVQTEEPKEGVNAEEPKEDIQAEEPKEDEPTGEEPEETPVETEDEEEPDEEDFITGFNEKFKSEFKTEDEITELLSSKTKVGELSTQVSEYQKKIEELEKELDEQYEKSHPEKIYGGREGYEKFLISEKGEKEGYNDVVVDRIIGNDITKFSDLEMIMMDIENSSEKLSGKYDILRDMALDEVGVDVDALKSDHARLRKETLEDEDKDIGDFDYGKIRISSVQEGKLIRKAKQIRDKFNDFKKVEVPEYKNRKEAKEQALSEIKGKHEKALSNWGDRIDTLVDDFKISYSHKDLKNKEDVFEFVDEDFNKAIKDTVAEKIKTDGIEPTKENIETIKTEIENSFWANKKTRERALKKIIDDAKMRTEDVIDDEVTNNKPISKEKAPKENKGKKNESLENWLRGNSVSLESVINR